MVREPMANRKSTAPAEIKRKLITMPLSLFEELERTARKNERNPEAEIRFAIRQHVDRELEEAA